MISKIKSKFQTNERKALISNFLSLSTLQLVNYIIPLITIPYLFNILGAEKFGLVVFAQALVAYFGIIINYGFNLSATREVSIHRNDINKISTIFSSIFFIKLLFTIILFSIFIFVIFYFEKFNKEWELYLFSFAMVIESLLFPVWFYQGMEKMKFITIIYAISKIVFIVLIFSLINSPDDYIKIPILYFVGSLVSGIISMIIVFKFFKINFVIPKITDISNQLKNGWHLFLSNLFINLYRNANVVILGFLTSPVFVGYYALAEKIIKALQSLLAPISDTLYPYIAKRNSNQEKSKSIEDLFKMTKYYLIILISLTIGILIFSPLAVKLISGEYISNVIIDLRVLSLVVFFGGLNYLFGILGLVNLGYKEYFTKSVATSGVFNISLCVFLSFYFNDLGASIALTLTEILLFSILIKKIYQIKKVH